MDNKDIQNFGKGAFRDRFDSRDLKWAPLAKALGIEKTFDWNIGTDTEEKLNIKIKHENQGSQSSCAANALSTYGDVLNYVETKKWEDFGSKGLYAQVALPGGGSYLRDNLDIAVNQGFYLESDLPSYDINGNPVSEEEVRRAEDITSEMRKKAKQWKSLRYYQLPANDIDSWATAIENHWGIYMGATGSNEGWSQPDLRAPLPGESTWGHSILGKAAKIRNGKKAIKIHNSWSNSWAEGGDGWIDEDYVKSNNIFVPWVLIDMKNINIKNMLETIKKIGDPNIYIKSNTNNNIYPIGAWGSYQEMLIAGWIKSFEEVSTLDAFDIIDSPMGFLK